MRRRVHRLMGGGRTVLWDSFTDVDGTPLSGHGSDGGGGYIGLPGSSGVIGIPTVSSGRLTSANVVESGFFLHTSRLRRRNGSVQAGIIRVATLNASNIEIEFRVGPLGAFTQARDSVGARYIGITAAWQILSQSSGPQVGTNIAQTLTLNQVYQARLELRGPVILFWVDGVLTRQDQDVRTRRGTRAAIKMQNSDTNAPALRADNWMVTR
ncbi:MAG: hypothetical protein ACRDGM_07865 [bacterium]